MDSDAGLTSKKAVTVTGLVWQRNDKVVSEPHPRCTAAWQGRARSQ